jgi:hypothetical protein
MDPLNIYISVLFIARKLICLKIVIILGLLRLHNEELHNLYTSPYIVRMTKSRRMRWVGNVACMGGVRNACIILVGKLEGKSSWKT